MMFSAKKVFPALTPASIMLMRPFLRASYVVIRSEMSEVTDVSTRSLRTRERFEDISIPE